MAAILGVPIEILIIVGLVLKVVGFAFRDELWLRLLVACGMLADLAYYALRPDPILQSVFTNGIMATINIALLLLILRERTTFTMDDRQRHLYEAFPTLSPGQFRKLYTIVRWRRTEAPTVLLHEDLPVPYLCYVYADSYTIRKNGTPYMAEGPAFIGEIALLTGRTSSATVELPAGTRYVEFPIDEIRRLMDRSAGFHNSMVALFAADLAMKVTYSTPMDRPGSSPQDTTPPPDVPGEAPRHAGAV